MKKLQQREGNEGRLVSGRIWSEDTCRGWSGFGGLESAPHKSSYLIVTCSLASCQSFSAPPTAQLPSIRSPHPSILEPEVLSKPSSSPSLRSNPWLSPSPCPISVSTDSNTQVSPSLFLPQIFPNYLVLDTGLRDTDSRQET